MAKLKSLDDLKQFRDYRIFLRDAVKALEGAEKDAPCFISREELTFDLGGKEWTGYALLVGDRGADAAKAIRKEGVQFREGRCRVQGDDLGVGELAGALVKGANVTLKKLGLGCRLVPLADDGGTDGAAGGGAAAKEFEKLKKKIFPHVKPTAAKDPPNRAEIVTLAKQAAAFEKEGDYTKALEAVKRLGGAIKGAASTGGAGGAEKTIGKERADASAATGEQGAYLARKAKILPRVKQILGKDPKNKADINRFAKETAEFEKEGNWSRALVTLQKLTDAMKAAATAAKEGGGGAEATSSKESATQAAPDGDAEGGGDPDEAADESLELRDWAAYTKYMRAELKKLKPEPMPFFLSRKRTDFEDGGAKWSGNALFAGKRARAQAKLFVRDGVLFDEGMCRANGKALVLEGFEPARIKAAQKTLKRLKLGYKVSLPRPGNAPPADLDAAITSAMPPPPTGGGSVVSTDENARLAGLSEEELRGEDLTVRNANELFTEDYMDGLVGLEIQGANTADMKEIMRQLERGASGAQRTELIEQLAQIRGGDPAKLDADYSRFLILRAQQNAVRKDKDGEVVPSLAEDVHGEFMGSNPQLVFGKVVGDAFGIDPVFGALLSPTGGMVGPGNMALHLADDDPTGYHGIVHDAAGYLTNYHDQGPGYNYLGSEDRDTADPLTGQQSGMRYWHEKLDPGATTTVMLGAIDAVYASKDGIEEAVELAKKGASTVEEEIENAMVAVEQATEYARDVVTDAIDDAMDAAERAYYAGEEAVLEAAEDVERAAREAAREAERVAREAAAEAERATREAARAVDQAAREAAREAERVAREAARATEQAAREAARATEEAARQAARAAEQAAREAASAVEEAARDAARAAREAAAAVEDTVVETANAVSDTVSDVASAASDKLEGAWNAIWD